MPIYEYRCAACGHELEALQRLSDAPLTLCPSCQKPALKKLVSAAGFQLKGSGWYVTDFRNNGAKPAAKEKAGGTAAATAEAATTDTGGAADAGSAGAKGTESKAADKPAAATPAATPAAPAASTRKSDS
jgi:putative FmdB family regulatory protein